MKNQEIYSRILKCDRFYLNYHLYSEETFSLEARQAVKALYKTAPSLTATCKEWYNFINSIIKPLEASFNEEFEGLHGKTEKSFFGALMVLNINANRLV